MIKKFKKMIPVLATALMLSNTMGIASFDDTAQVEEKFEVDQYHNQGIQGGVLNEHTWDLDVEGWTLGIDWQSPSNYYEDLHLSSKDVEELNHHEVYLNNDEVAYGYNKEKEDWLNDVFKFDVFVDGEYRETHKVSHELNENQGNQYVKYKWGKILPFGKDDAGKTVQIKLHEHKDYLVPDVHKFVHYQDGSDVISVDDISYESPSFEIPREEMFGEHYYAKINTLTKDTYDKLEIEGLPFYSLENSGEANFSFENGVLTINFNDDMFIIDKESGYYTLKEEYKEYVIAGEMDLYKASEQYYGGSETNLYFSKNNQEVHSKKQDIESDRRDEFPSVSFKSRLKVTHGSIVIKKPLRYGDWDSDEGVEGVEFVLEDLEGNILRSKRTDSNGSLEFMNIPIGQYKVREIGLIEGKLEAIETYEVKLEGNQSVEERLDFEKDEPEDKDGKWNRYMDYIWIYNYNKTTEYVEIPYETVYIEDPSLNEDEEIIETDGELGLLERELEYKMQKDKKIELVNVNEKVINEPVDEIILVGANEDEIVYEEVVEEKTIPFETIYIEDPNLKLGKEVLQQIGSDGYAEQFIQIKYVNGVEIERTLLEENVLYEPIDEVILVGSGVDSDEVILVETETDFIEIPFETIYKEDSSVPKGEEIVETEGSHGLVSRTEEILHYESGKIERTIVDETIINKPTNKVILVGTKVHVPEVSVESNESKDDFTDFETEYVDSEDLEEGVEEVIQEGKKGYTITKETHTLEDGIIVKTEVETEVVEPISKIVAVGVKHEESSTQKPVREPVDTGIADYSLFYAGTISLGFLVLFLAKKKKEEEDTITTE